LSSFSLAARACIPSVARLNQDVSESWTWWMKQVYRGGTDRVFLFLHKELPGSSVSFHCVTWNQSKINYFVYSFRFFRHFISSSTSPWLKSSRYLWARWRDTTRKKIFGLSSTIMVSN
jgi:hypothetical protein